MLAVDDTDITGLPYVRRRDLLEQLSIVEKPKTLIVPPSWTDVSPTDVLAVAKEHRYEGIVSKLLTSPYRAGRTTAWIKTPVRCSTEAVIVGFVVRRQAVATLVLACHDETGRLVLLGQVGAGIGGNTGRHLLALLQRIERKTPPLTVRPDNVAQPHVRWVTPKYVGEVQ